MELPRDVAAVRLDNALVLFDEFVRSTVKHPDAATLRGLERRFAGRLQIQPSYWSQIKGRSRQIGERLARQFEQNCHKPHGWMDQPQAGGRAGLGVGARPHGGGESPLPPAPGPGGILRSRRTTPSASSWAWCCPTTAATPNAPAPGCWICWAKC